MIATYKKVLSTLLKRNKNKTSNSDTKLSEDQEDNQRCEQILNYWLDAELFDLPECPMNNDKNIVSEKAEAFIERWGNKANQRYVNGELSFNNDSRLLVMFQCHRAGYLIESEECHPNYVTPRSFLVAQAMVPSWDEERQTIVWHRSEDDEDLVVNLATIRTLYRKCRSSVPDNMSLSQWVEARFETIENRLSHELDPVDEEPDFDTKTLTERIRRLNRELADEFWPDEQAREYIAKRCQPIESQLQDDDKPECLECGTVTFRWRFCFYPKGNETNQVGPFFVQDLESVIAAVNKHGSRQGLSLPLARYLCGAESQQELGSALSSAKTLFPLTQNLLKGRWPENPEFSLSLMQTVAVNLASDAKNNPVVAVNGPPGTGKTTLLKDVIAQKFVQRTEQLLALSMKKNWLTSAEATEVILSHSILVASSNNKAVENISKELPSMSRLAGQYQGETRHFRPIAEPGHWGLFCAVLGNNDNRKEFKKTLNKLVSHLNGLEDYFCINHFVNTLRKYHKENPGEKVKSFVDRWQENGELVALCEAIRESGACRQRYPDFFKPFCEALESIANASWSVDKFADYWAGMNEAQWEVALSALESLKKEWWVRKLAVKALDEKVATAKDEFEKALSAYQCMRKDVATGNTVSWQLNESEHLLSPKVYSVYGKEDPIQAETRLQKSAPFGSEAINHCRTQLFIKALALNEALAEQAGLSLKSHWQNLESLIDGKLETQEGTPEHALLWAMLFMFFPVISTSLASVGNQFKLMQKKSGFGLAMFDESGQAVNYHVVGLLQRCRQAIFVGDPIQLEPVVAMQPKIDQAIARDFIALSHKDGEATWGDPFVIGNSSAQSIADRAGNFVARIGERTVGIPLLVHRRCSEPMFSIVNKIAYDNKMVLASQPFRWQALQSGWVHVEEHAETMQGSSYYNEAEARAAMQLTEFLCREHPDMVKGGVYIITPFSKMKATLQKRWRALARQPENHIWMQLAFGEAKSDGDIDDFAKENIGTVHTFQGKEASTVLLCTAASKKRKNDLSTLFRTHDYAAFFMASKTSGASFPLAE